MKILVAINNLTSVSQLAYSNHCQFWYRLGRNMPEHQFGLCNPRRMSIDRMRNFAAKAVLENDFDYLLFIDDDVLVPFDTVKYLIEDDKDVVAGVTLIRGYPYHPMIFNFVSPQLAKDGRTHFIDNYEELADKETGLLECDAVGFSCCLIKAKVLREIKPPYFITIDENSGINSAQCTEDVYFCNKVKMERPGTQIFVDTRIKTAHILGDDIVEPDNLGPRMLFDEAMRPGVADQIRLAESRMKLIDPKVIRKVDYKEYIKEKVFG